MYVSCVSDTSLSVFDVGLVLFLTLIKFVLANAQNVFHRKNIEKSSASFGV